MISVPPDVSGNAGQMAGDRVMATAVPSWRVRPPWTPPYSQTVCFKYVTGYSMMRGCVRDRARRKRIVKLMTYSDYNSQIIGGQSGFGRDASASWRMS